MRIQESLRYWYKNRREFLQESAFSNYEICANLDTDIKRL